MKKIEQSLTIFLIGATGDLSSKKILPAIYELFERKLLPSKFVLVGNSRKSFSGDDFVQFIRKNVKPTNEKKFAQFAKSIHFVAGDVTNSETFTKLSDYHKNLNHCGNHLWYVATLPSLYTVVSENIAVASMNDTGCGWTKLLLEKPFGINTASAEKLNKSLLKVFKEDQIYRIDHFLAKETVQNLLVFRFANSLFEHLWSHQFVDHIQISAPEDFGIKGREKFYDATGTVRDVIQNHLLMLLATALMEEPETLEASAIRKNRLKLISDLKPLTASIAKDETVFAQYQGYETDIVAVGLKKSSETETAFAGKFEVDNQRWRGVPIYVRAGKKMKRKMTEISFVFKTAGKHIFYNADDFADTNVLTLRIQPNEGIVVRLKVKKPGFKMKLEDVPMQFCYKSEFQMGLVEAYAKLIHDAVAGEQMLFPQEKEIEMSWKFVEPLLNFKKNGDLKLYKYKVGSWGPKEFDDLIKKDGREWIVPSIEVCKID